MFALFLPALIGALVGAVGSIVGRAIIASGIGFVTYKGLDVALGAIKSQVISGLSANAGDVAGLLGFLYFDRALMLIFSAVTVSLSLRLIGGSIKKLIHK